MLSLGIEPSTTSTNGASSVPSAASRNGLRNSSPPSEGSSTLLCRWTFGSPGIAPSSTSSMLGWPAAVIETESPSQLMPSEIQRTWTSSTPALVSAAMSHLLLFELERVDQQLLAPDHLDVEPPARRALQGERRQRTLRGTCPAASRRRHLLKHELRARERRPLSHQLEGEGERVGDDLAQVAD